MPTAPTEVRPRQFCSWCLRTVGTLPSGETRRYTTVELDPWPDAPNVNPEAKGRRRLYHMCSPDCRTS